MSWDCWPPSATLPWAFWDIQAGLLIGRGRNRSLDLLLLSLKIAIWKNPTLGAFFPLWPNVLHTLHLAKIHGFGFLLLAAVSAIHQRVFINFAQCGRNQKHKEQSVLGHGM